MARRTTLLVVLAILPGPWSNEATAEPPQTRPLVLLARLDDQAINPLTARYIIRAIEQAEEQNAECVVLMLDTPGGLVNATRDIVKAILNSKVPVIVYVAPSGARAASAGLFITLAGHRSAMAPGTNIGAAHPVQIGGLPGGSPSQEGEEGSSPMEEKAVNDTTAWARSLAKLRDRNEEWAVKAVEESKSASVSEDARRHALRQLDQLPDSMKELQQAQDPYPVEVSESLQHDLESLRRQLESRQG